MKKSTARKMTGERSDSRIREARLRRAQSAPDRPRGVIDRDLLLEIAAELFARKGYRATTLDDLGAAMGIKKASLYHYISSKEEILIDLYDRIYELSEERIMSVVETQIAPDEKLRRMIIAYVEMITGHTDMFAMALRNEQDLSEDDRKKILKRHRKMERVFEEVIISGQKEGTIADFDPRLMGLAIFGMLLFVQYWYRNTSYTVEQISSTFMTLLERGWRSGEERKVWSRPDSLEDALSPIQALVETLDRDVSALRESINAAHNSLADGLALSMPKSPTRK